MRAKHWRRVSLAAVLAPVAALGLLSVLPGSASATGPAAPSDVLNFLNQISGNHTVSGVHNKEPLSSPGQYTAQAHDITGKWPGLWGGEMGFTDTDIANRQTMINQAKTEWNNGSLVNLTWHMCLPNVASCQFSGGINGSSLSDSDWNQLITDGTTLNNDYKAKLDTAVPYLQQLKDAGVPVLFRPLHEMNDSWAWWGGRPGPNGSARLYQITHDYLESKGLTNIIWVWNVKDVGDPSTAAQYYPGNQYVDVVSLDPWNEGFPSGSWYDEMQSIAGSKPISLAEVGTVPSPGQLASQPRWTWFMIWSDYITSANSPAGLQATFDDSQVLSQGGFTISTSGGTTGGTTGGSSGGSTGGTGGGSGQITGYARLCVDVRGANSTNFTAVQVYTCNGTNAQQWTVNSANNTLSALGKCLDVDASGTANGTTVDLYDCNGTGAQTWVPQSNGSLLNPNSGKCLDDTGWSTTPGTQLQIWDCTGNANQQWNLPG